MKKSISTLLMLVVSAFGFAACSDSAEPLPVIAGGESGNGDSEGTS